MGFPAKEKWRCGESRKFRYAIGQVSRPKISVRRQMSRAANMTMRQYMGMTIRTPETLISPGEI